MIWDDNFLKIAHHPFYAPELLLLFFYFEGKVPLSRQGLETSSNGGKTKSSHNFGIRRLIMSCPWTFLRSSFLVF